MKTRFWNSLSLAVAGLCLALMGTARGAGSGTLDNLQAAYNGESNAKARYEAFAVKADAEGYQSAASLFRAVAKSEGIHVAKHAAMIRKLGAEPKATLEAPVVKSTRENLEAALGGETKEKDSMYPAFIKQAEAEGQAGAVMSFKGAQASEVSHADLFKQALENLDAWKAPGKAFLVCTVCGYTTMNAGIKQCPICAAPRSKFETVK